MIHQGGGECFSDIVDDILKGGSTPGEFSRAEILMVASKPPTAELRPGQLDQDSLPPYEILDKILEGLIEEDLSIEQLVHKGYDRGILKMVESLIFNSEYKRYQAAPGVHLTDKSFWLGRRYPIVQKWRDKS